MAVFGAVSDMFVGEWYSPALAIALVTVLIIMLLWIFGMDSKSSTLVKWVGGLAAFGYLGLGIVHKNLKKTSSISSLASEVVAI